MHALAEVKIGSDLQDIESQLRKAEFKMPQRSEKDYLVGNLILRSSQETLSVDLNNRAIIGY